MKKPDEQIKSALREGYRKECNNYLTVLLKMWELDSHYGYWNSDRPGTIYHYGDTHNLSMEDIIYIVENDIEEDEVIKWEDYCLEAHEYGFTMPNLPSWHKGAPRVPKETFEHLRKLKEELANAINEAKEDAERTGQHF